MKNEQEAEYRRGYQDGWIEAVNALGDLMDKETSAQEIYDRLFTHWEQVLLTWGKASTDNVEFPPAMPIER